MGRVLVSFALAGAAFTAAAPAANLSGDLRTVLRYAPTDTNLLVVVPSLDGLVSGVRAFGGAIQQDDLAEFQAGQLLAEPLGGALEGIDPAGPVVLAVSAEHPGVLLLARAKSADTWAGNRELEAVGTAHIYELQTVGVAGLTTERVVVIGREAAGVRRGLAGGELVERLPDEFARIVEQRQVAIWASVPPWKARLDETLALVAQTAYMGLAAAPNSELIIPIYKMFFDQLGRMVGQTEAFVAAASIDGQGLFIEQRARFARDGFVAEYLGKVRPAELDPLRGLPDGVAMAFACEWQMPDDAASLNEAMARTLFQSEALMRKVPAEQLEGAVTNTVETYRHMTGLSCAFTNAPTEEGWLIFGTYLSTRHTALQDALRRGFTDYPEVMKAWGAAPTANLQHEQDTVRGVKADVFRFSFAEIEFQMQPVIEAMYGKDTAMIIAPCGEGCLYVMGPSRSARAQAEKMLGTPAPLRESPAVKALLERFRPRPQAVFLIDIPHWFELIGQIVRKTGMMFPPLDFAKRNFALAGGALYLEPDALRLELFVPAEPIRAILDAVGDAERSQQAAY